MKSRSWAFNTKYQDKIKNNDKDDYLKSNLKPKQDTWNYDGRRPSQLSAQKYEINMFDRNSAVSSFNNGSRRVSNIKKMPSPIRESGVSRSNSNMSGQRSSHMFK